MTVLGIDDYGDQADTIHPESTKPWAWIQLSPVFMLSTTKTASR